MTVPHKLWTFEVFDPVHGGASDTINDAAVSVRAGGDGEGLITWLMDGIMVRGTVIQS